jgi:hypothetical protein
MKVERISDKSIRLVAESNSDSYFIGKYFEENLAKGILSRVDDKPLYLTLTLKEE